MEQELLVVVETDYASDAEELAMLAQSLRQELLMTEVQDVRPATSGEVPEGAKGLGAVDWNALLVALGSSGGVLTGLVGALVSWIRRNQGTTLKLSAADCEVELKGANVDLLQVQAVLETCLKKRAAEASEDALSGVSEPVIGVATAPEDEKATGVGTTPSAEEPPHAP